FVTLTRWILCLGPRFCQRVSVTSVTASLGHSAANQATRVIFGCGVGRAVSFVADSSCLRGVLTAWLAVTVLAAQSAPRPTAPRIQPLPEAQWTDDIRAVFTRFGQGAPAGNDFKTLARHPELLKKVVPFATYISSESG